MKIDGKQIASEIKSNLKEKIAKLKSQNIIPHLAVVLIGNDPSSQVYVRQKLKVGEELGIRVSFFPLEQSAMRLNLILELKNLIKRLNNDSSIHGIIIQRPVSLDISKEELDLSVVPQKDVDGFHPKSPFTPPIASAVIYILNYVYQIGKGETPRIKAVVEKRGVNNNSGFRNWLKTKRILVIGRGETAGKPIAETLQKLGAKPEIAHSKTTNLKELCLKSDIIISCVGKRPILRLPGGSTQKGPYVVRHQHITNKTILVGVGLHPENGKLATDYDQEEIKEIVAFYTPVPGGVGPVNVACLFENLITSCKLLK